MSPRIARVYCYGDSLTQVSGYPELLQRKLADQRSDIQWKVINGGLCGMTVFSCSPEGTGLPDYIRMTTTAESIDVMVIMLGTNDGASRLMEFDEEAFSRRLSAVATNMQCLAPSSKLVLAIPPPVSKGCGLEPRIINVAIPKLIPAVAIKLGAPCIDCSRDFRENDGLQEDGIHLTKAGADMVASSVVPYVLNAVCPTPPVVSNPPDAFIAGSPSPTTSNTSPKASANAKNVAVPQSPKNQKMLPKPAKDNLKAELAKLETKMKDIQAVINAKTIQEVETNVVDQVLVSSTIQAQLVENDYDPPVPQERIAENGPPVPQEQIAEKTIPTGERKKETGSRREFPQEVAKQSSVPLQPKVEKVVEAPKKIVSEKVVIAPRLAATKMTRNVAAPMVHPTSKVKTVPQIQRCV